MKTLDLSGYTGSEVLYRHTFPWLRYTEGVKAMAEQAGAWWLVDAIASYQMDKRITHDPQRMLQDFQLWQLRCKDGKATLTLRRDSGKGQRPVITQRLLFTDFPADEFTLYVENHVLLLPQEH